MKKKAYLAVLAACMSLMLTACAQETVKKDETESVQQSEEETEAGGTKSVAKNGLVTVKNAADYVAVGDYKGIELEKMAAEVTEEQIDVTVANAIGSGEEVSGGTVQAGDTVTIDYVGTRDGEAFDGGSAENYDLLIGSGTFIDGFEAGLVGMKKGETRHLDLTFPADYRNQEMAGAAVTFQVTLQKFVRPQLTDEWAAANTDYQTAAEYREAVRAQLLSQAEEAEVQRLKQSAWEQVLVSSEVTEYPNADLEDAANEFRQEIQLYADQSGMELADFLAAQGMTEEQLEEVAGQYAQAKVKQNLIVQCIMDAEGMSLSDDQSAALLQELIAQLGAGSEADLIDVYGQELVDESIGLLRVENFIYENAVIVDAAAAGADAAADTGAAEGAQAADSQVDAGAAADAQTDAAADTADAADSAADTDGAEQGA